MPKQMSKRQAIVTLMDEATNDRITPKRIIRACKALHALGIGGTDAQSVLAQLELCDTRGNAYTSDEAAKRAIYNVTALQPYTEG